jgi:hypothetical protein
MLCQRRNNWDFWFSGPLERLKLCGVWPKLYLTDRSVLKRRFLKEIAIDGWFSGLHLFPMKQSIGCFTWRKDVILDFFKSAIYRKVRFSLRLSFSWLSADKFAVPKKWLIIKNSRAREKNVLSFPSPHSTGIYKGVPLPERQNHTG